MNKIAKDALLLTAITLVAGLLLGFVHDITLEPIAEQERIAKEKACREVFRDASEFTQADLTDAGGADAVDAYLTEQGYTAQSVDEVWVPMDASGEALGLIVTVTSSEGYGGDIQFSMGISKEGTMTGIAFLSIKETAGLGMRANTDEFRSQFRGKNVEKFTYSKTGATADNEIDALSGATITTNAVTNGVNAGLSFFRYWQDAKAAA